MLINKKPASLQQKTMLTPWVVSLNMVLGMQSYHRDKDAFSWCWKFLDAVSMNIMTSSIGNIFPRYWPFVRGIHRSKVNSPHKGQWREALMFSLIRAWINGWVNNREACDLRRHRIHYDIIVMIYNFTKTHPCFYDIYIYIYIYISSVQFASDISWRPSIIDAGPSSNFWHKHCRSMNNTASPAKIIYHVHLLVELTKCSETRPSSVRHTRLTVCRSHCIDK